MSLLNTVPYIRPKPPKKIKPLGSTSPWVWVIEPYFGCNLKCAHCCAGLIEKTSHVEMSKEVWEATWTTINEVSPTVRVDICGIVGEPTLNQNLAEWLPFARKAAPLAQIQITTNGTMLRKGHYTMKQLLDAGANIIYVDQYGPHEVFEKLASESGYPFYQYYDKPADAPSPWTYWGPEMKLIALQDAPHNWPKSRRNANLLGNWYGNLDWKRGAKFGMKPLEEPLTRRCNQPFLYVNVAATGDFLLCCQDGMHVTAGKFGNVLGGAAAFREFWFGEEMQTVRARLRNKDRAGTSYACAKCNITFSRCDFKHWTDEEVGRFWDGSSWREIESGRELPQNFLDGNGQIPLGVVVEKS